MKCAHRVMTSIKKKKKIIRVSFLHTWNPVDEISLEVWFRGKKYPPPNICQLAPPLTGKTVLWTDQNKS